MRPNEAEAVAVTDAKITATVLQAQRRPDSDGPLR
jgi:hypothetical protein